MPPVVVLVPYPAQGHITPMLQLARALNARHIDPVLALPDFTYRRLKPRLCRADIGGGVRFASIMTGLGDEGNDFFAIDGAMENHMPAHLERLLRGLEGEVVCVVVDLLASWAIKVADRCGFRCAGFWPAMLATYRIISAIPQLIRGGFISECGTPLHLHELHSNNDNHEQSGKSLIPTKPELRTKDLPWLVGSTAAQKSRFNFWLRTISRTETLRWLLVNSFPEENFPEENCEHDELIDGTNSPQIFQIGPLLANNNDHNNAYPSMWEEDTSCMQWLQNQPPSSVIYVSFGSWVGPIVREKITELAHGLEATNRPFLWVLRDDVAWRSGLPAGFLDRVAGHGRIVGWVPQEAVLSHEAVGCYVTHCGWNSTMEAIRHEKRLVCYPISGDQFVNCNYIVKVWRVGLKLAGFGRGEIEETIKRIMAGKEGVEIQGRMTALKKKVMGKEGKCKAEASLHLFMDVITTRAE